MELISLTEILKLAAALAFVVALMGGLSLAIRKLGLAENMSVKSGNVKRLKIVEAIPLDPRRRAVLLRCDDKDHLVILGPNGETVIKTDLKPAKDEA
ncbi:MAG: flagellar biosynthetic protein FliO [Alphaproteobacteria bacterium]|nr:flagellar biosynthetic protein FliO [Alphaproteobacteria bacterium]MCD8519814.1 flagellar biosynthetic protein FliO [Alphaproteobacteria bacterium]MCD8570278.1 flagellar biosynthetic protein FliO [Alphaproteobacteria bacterium]